jgi:signal transduction histidine kinase/ligand-binding sensor domain-containing protein
MTLRHLPAVGILLACVASPAAALDANARITQYVHTAWRVQEGAFDAAPNAVTQTSDGYIWIGTNSGLLRYDGVRFAPWTLPASKTLSAIISLQTSSNGTLWIGTSTGLFSWKDNRLQRHVPGRINSIVEDRKGRIWVARTRVQGPSGGLCEVLPSEVKCFGGEDQPIPPTASALFEDARANLWIGSSSQLTRRTDTSTQVYFKKQLEPFRGLSAIESIAATADGSVWATVPLKGFGLHQITGDGSPIKVSLEGIDTTQITTLFMDRERSLWMTTRNSGIYRIFGKRIDHFRAEDGLSSNVVTNVYQDKEGNIWLATSKGLDCFRDSRVMTFSTSEGLKADLASSLLATPDGSVWIGNSGSLDVLRGNTVNSIAIPGQGVTSLWQDRSGRLWVGVDRLLTIYDQGRFQTVNRPDGGPLGIAVAITEDREQNIWVSVVGPNPKLFRIHGLRVQEEIDPGRVPTPRLLAADPGGGIWLSITKGKLGRYRNGKLESFQLTQDESQLQGLSVGADGSVWASTRNGLYRWKDGQIKALTSRNGLPCDSIHNSIRDNQNNLWLYTKCGLIAITDAELERWWQQPDTRIETRILDVLDGARPGPSTFQPAASKSPDGRLWFVNDAVVQMVNPQSALERHGTSLPIYVEQVRADRRDYPASAPVKLPAQTRDIEIGYTALSYAIPQKVRFRYKLSRRDLDWQDADTRRTVLYSDLPPGQYRFQVIATTGDGTWNAPGASLDFEIAPAYYQTPWFQIACTALFLAGLWALYRYRLSQIAHEFNVRLEERVSERTRIARDLHDTLLQSFQGLMLRLQVVQDLLPEGRAKQELEQSLQRADQAIAEGRNAVYDLRSSATISNELAQAVKALGEELVTPESASFRLVVEGTSRELHPIVRDEFYSIAREALRNAFKHAKAQHVEAEITYTDRMLRLRVRDDGTGIAADVLQQGRSGHFGLRGMRERAEQIGGKLDIWNGPKTGTEIELSLDGSIAYREPARRPFWSMLRKRERA